MKITETLNNFKIRGLIINLIFTIVLSSIRWVNKLFKVNDGSIVIVALHRLGDSVFTIPAILQIQKFYNREVILFCYSESVPIFKIILKNVIYCSVERTDFFYANRIASIKARKKLSKCQPSTIIDLTGVMTSASLIFNSRAGKLIGMNREIFKSIYDVYIPVFYKSHLSEMYLNVAKLIIGKNETVNRYESPSTINKVEKIIIHPFAGWKAKEWNLNKYIKLAKALIENYHVAIVIPGNYLTRDVIEEIKNVKIEIAETKNIDELILVLNNYSLLIGNDSGPIHIASLLGKATFTIYGPSNPIFTIPYGLHHGYYQKLIKCSPISTENLCFTDGGRYGCPSFECMNELSVDDVLEKIKIFIFNLDNNRVEL